MRKLSGKKLSLSFFRRLLQLAGMRFYSFLLCSATRSLPHSYPEIAVPGCESFDQALYRIFRRGSQLKSMTSVNRARDQILRQDYLIGPRTSPIRDIAKWFSAAAEMKGATRKSLGRLFCHYRISVVLWLRPLPRPCSSNSPALAVSIPSGLLLRAPSMAACNVRHAAAVGNTAIMKAGVFVTTDTALVQTHHLLNLV
jgi:hypothetical protein